MFETAEEPLLIGEWKKNHPEYKKIEQHLEEATGEKPDSVHSLKDPDHKPTNIVDMAGQFIDPGKILGSDQTENIEGVTESAKSGFLGWAEGYFKNRARVSDNPKDFIVEADKHAKSLGQVKEVPLKKAA